MSNGDCATLWLLYTKTCEQENGFIYAYTMPWLYPITLISSLSLSLSFYSTAAAEAFGSPGDLQLGANAHAFVRIAEAMIDQGCV